MHYNYNPHLTLNVAFTLAELDFKKCILSQTSTFELIKWNKFHLKKPLFTPKGLGLKEKPEKYWNVQLIVFNFINVFSYFFYLVLSLERYYLTHVQLWDNKISASYRKYSKD